MQFFTLFACQTRSNRVYFARPHQGTTKQSGVLAQLVERFNGIEEVSGSNPLCSTSTDGRQIFRESASCFIFTYGLAGYALPCCIPVGAKTGR